MELSPENIVTGTVVEIKEGLLMTEVRVDIGGDEFVTLMVTDEALKELDARVGDEMEFLINAGVTAARTFH